ncbi:MAG: hypothetical protein R3324_08630 [Halobacteriales archaeon]|nr:hypothetical protein [Halobacteriales archaeon]
MTIREWFSLEGTHFEGDEYRFRLAWLLAAATYGVGDIVTTVAVVFFDPSIQEANPLMQAAADAVGALGVVPLKLAVFLLFIGVSVYLARMGEEWLSYAPPAVLTVSGTLVTVHNLIGLAA